MKTVDLDPELFIENRRRLRTRLLPNSIAVVHANDVMPTNADGAMPFQQNADLFYLTGVNQEESIFLLAPHAAERKFREILFVRETNEQIAIWEGAKLTREQAAKVSGIHTVRWLSDFPALFRLLVLEAENVYLNTNEHARASVEVQTRDGRFISDCQRKFPLHRYHRLAPLMHELRAVKSPSEVQVIRRACDITRKGFLRVCKFVKPGVNEAEPASSGSIDRPCRTGGFDVAPASSKKVGAKSMSSTICPICVPGLISFG